jgi:hypothetical protein
MAEKQYTLNEIEHLLKIVGQTQTKHNPAAGASTFNYAHGPGGMFSEPGIHPDMHSTLIKPRTITDAIPWLKSNIINEKISILTGQLASEGTNAANTCADPPNPGDLKKCTRTSLYGKLFMKTKKVDITEIGRINDRADVERRIMNFAATGSPLVPELLKRPGLNFMSTTTQALLTLGVMLERVIAALEISGNSAVTGGASTTLGVIDEFDGLDQLITTGHTDLATSVACPAADSHVINWNAVIGGTFQGLTIMQLLNDVYFSRKMLAMDVGMENTQWAWVMDKRLFRALAQVAACTFPNTRCSDFTAGTPGGRTQSEIEARFLEMQRGQFLLVDGDAIPVLFTSGIDTNVPDASGNGITGDIRLVPMNWSGGPLLFGEYFPMDNQWITEWEGVAQENRVSHNNGMFLTATRSDGFCDELLLTGMFRLRLDAPFLAARVDNVTFDGYTGYRQYDPGGTFFYDGGVTFYNA